MHFANLPFPQVLASASDSAAPPGPCRKPPGALYVESGKGWVLSLAPVHFGRRSYRLTRLTYRLSHFTS